MSTPLLSMTSSRGRLVPNCLLALNTSLYYNCFQTPLCSNSHTGLYYPSSYVQILGLAYKAQSTTLNQLTAVALKSNFIQATFLNMEGSSPPTLPIQNPLFLSVHSTKLSIIRLNKQCGPLNSKEFII